MEEMLVLSGQRPSVAETTMGPYAIGQGCAPAIIFMELQPKHRAAST